MAQEVLNTGLKTRNMDIYLLCMEISLYRKEVKRAVANEVYNVNEHDRARLASYLFRLKADLDHVSSVPRLDLPKWHKTDIPLPDIPNNDLSEIDNPHGKYVITMLDAMYYELANSNSSDLPSFLEPHDKGRCEAVIAKLENWLKTLEETQPLDLPEGADANNAP